MGNFSLRVLDPAKNLLAPEGYGGIFLLDNTNVLLLN